MNWNSTNANECHVLAGAGFSTGGLTSGSDSVSALAGTTTFSIQCTGAGGSVQANSTVSATAIATPVNPTVTLTANPSSIQSGQNSILNWYSTNATSCSDSWTGSNSTSGSQAVYPTSTTTYSITCYGASGSTPASSSATVYVNQAQQPTVTLTANPSSIQAGQNSTLSWTSQYANSCSAYWTSSTATSGTGVVVPTSTTTYNITCSGASGTTPATASVMVYVNQVQNPTVTLSANPLSVNYNGSSTLTWNSSNVTSCSASGGTNGWSGSKNTSGTFNTGALTNTITYYINCTNNTGSANDSVTVSVGSQVLNPTVSLTADNSSVSYNGNTTLRWSSNNATSCSASNGTNGWSGNRSTSGTFNTGALTNSTTYNITCSNSTGSTYDSVTVSVGSQVLIPTVTLTANPSSIQSGGNSTLTWTSTNASYCSSYWTNSSATSGSGVVTPTSTTTYTTTCYNSSGQSAAATATVYVNQAQIPTVTLTANPSSIQWRKLYLDLDFH